MDHPPRMTEASALLDYHRASSHRAEAWAPGPLQVDWDSQPDPVRRWPGAQTLPLPRVALPDLRFEALDRPGAVPPQPLTLAGVAQLLQLSLGIAAWRQLGPDRWALRVNPSSGNLHPTEAHLLAAGIAGLPDGIHHHVPTGPLLEQRAATRFARPGLWVVLTSIHARETWKYGLRAFRYSLLDTGHALAALRYAAALLGWSAVPVPMPPGALARLLGLDDPRGAEAEDPELLLQIRPGPPAAPERPEPDPPSWQGRPARVCKLPPDPWPALDRAIRASAAPDLPGLPELAPRPPRDLPRPAAEVILSRRSARRLSGRRPLPAPALAAILEAMLPCAAPPFDALPWPVAIQPVIFVHNVEALPPGLYALPRGAGARAALVADFDPGLPWTPVAGLPLFRLGGGNLRPLARRLSGHQDIGGGGGMTIALLGDFGPLLRGDPGQYRRMHWEAGALGQRLYLEAGALGLGASGIGCFLDDEVRGLLGPAPGRFRSVYHFAIGHTRPDRGAAGPDA